MPSSSCLVASFHVSKLKHRIQQQISQGDYNINESDEEETFLRSICVGGRSGEFVIAGSEDSSIKVWRIKPQVTSEAKIYDRLYATLSSNSVWSFPYGKEFEGLIEDDADEQRGKKVKHEEGEEENEDSQSSRQALENKTGGKGGIYTVDAFNQYIAYGSDNNDDVCRIWDLESDKVVCTFNEDATGSGGGSGGAEQGVASLSFAGDGKHVAAGYLNCCIRIWDVATEKMVDKISQHSESIYSVKYSTSGKYLLSGSQDKTMKLFDLRQHDTSAASFSSAKSFSSMPSSLWQSWRNQGAIHNDYVLSVCFSPDENYVISGSKDKCVRLWDIRTQQCVKVLAEHHNSVLGIATAGNFLASGSGDCQVRVWQFDAN